jgi:hypothetical protein
VSNFPLHDGGYSTPGCDLKPHYDAGRYVDAIIPLGDGSRQIHIFCVCGHSGSNQNHATMLLNESLVTKAIVSVAASPAAIAGDFNVDLPDSFVIDSAISIGRLFDAVGFSAYCDEHVRPNTHSNNHVKNGWTGPNTSSIDAILLNPTCRCAFAKVDVCHDTAFGQHAPVRVTLNLKVFDPKCHRIKLQPAFDVDGIKIVKDEEAGDLGYAALVRNRALVNDAFASEDP